MLLLPLLSEILCKDSHNNINNNATGLMVSILNSFFRLRRNYLEQEGTWSELMPTQTDERIATPASGVPLRK